MRSARLFVEPDEDGGGAHGSEDRARTVFLRYDSPTLGRIDIALTLTGDAIGAALQLSAGEPARAARGGIRGAAGRARGGGGAAGARAGPGP